MAKVDDGYLNTYIDKSLKFNKSCPNAPVAKEGQRKSFLLPYHIITSHIEETSLERHS